MNQFFTNKKMIVLLVSVILFISLLSISITQGDSIPFVQQFTNDITAVMGRIFSRPISAVNDVFISIDNLQNTYEENQQLKSEIERVYETQAELATINEENERLREQIELESTLTDFTKISGTVISRNPDSWVDQVIIDRGSLDGIEIGMPVMSGNGLIGRIVEVNPTSSKVVLLTNIEVTSNQISAEITTEDEVVYGLVADYDEAREELIMNQISSDVEVEEGDLVTTSGLGGTIPRSLVIGTVTDVRLDSYGLSQQVYIEPAANFDQIRFVTIIERLAEMDTMDEENETDELEEEEVDESSEESEE